MRIKIFLGLALAVIGATLSIFFWDLEYGWFQGGPLGVLLLLVGLFEVGEELWRSRGRTHTRVDGGGRGPGDGD